VVSNKPTVAAAAATYLLTHLDSLLQDLTTTAMTHFQHNQRNRRERPNILFVAGMQLSGSGINPLRWNRTPPVPQIYDRTGRGTTDDPTVGWLFPPASKPDITEKLRQSHVDVARRVAIANGFNVIIIRQESHDEQYSYTATGSRMVTTGSSGRQEALTIFADLHITVYMGPDEKRAWVPGHIYVMEVDDPTGQSTIIRQLDDPVNQRRIVLPGRGRVAEEFWLTRWTKQVN
jgi:hypothetical protein